MQEGIKNSNKRLENGTKRKKALTIQQRREINFNAFILPFLLGDTECAKKKMMVVTKN
jgi:hypothetical protein